MTRGYEVAFWDGTEYDEFVIVVADTQAVEWGGTSTQDNREVGVLTGYCENAAGAEQPECPGWVEDSL